MTENRRESRETLLKIPRTLMSSRCKNTCRNGKILTMRKDLYEDSETI
jgi:hypothetical protein